MTNFQPADRFAPLPEDHFSKVVGESRCQEALRELNALCGPGENGPPRFPAVLVPEPDNPVDRNAIAVYGPTGRVGYLPRDDAERFRDTFDALRQAGYDGGSCSGLLTGGDREPPNHGVVLTLADPEVCEEYFGIVRGPIATGVSAQPPFQEQLAS